MPIKDALRVAYENSGWKPVQLAFHAGVGVDTAYQWLRPGSQRKMTAESYLALREALPGFKELVDAKPEQNQVAV